MYWLRRIPMVKVTLPLMAGIWMGWLIDQPGVFLLFFLFIVLCYFRLLYSRYSRAYTSRWLPGLLLNLALLFSGAILIALSREREAPLPEKPGLISFTVDEVPARKNDGWQCRGTARLVPAGTTRNAVLQLAVDSFPGIGPGDKLWIHARATLPPGPSNPLQFDLRSFLLHKNITTRIYCREDQVLGHWKNPAFSLYALSGEVRQLSVKRLQSCGLGGDELAIASALVIGEEELLTRELRSVYAATGAMHVLSVSGLHVGIVYLLLLIMLRPFRRYQQVAPLVSIPVLWLYAFVTGLSPSVLRSAMMFSLAAAGKLFRRDVSIYNTLAASAFLLLAGDPFLLFDVGFQLSYLALTGILLLQKPIASLLSLRNIALQKIWLVSGVAVAAQVSTTILSVYYFHQFPTYFLFSNLLVVPLSFVVLVAGILCLLLGWIPVFGPLAGTLLKWSVLLLNKGLEFFTDLPGSTIQNLYLSFGECLLLHLGLILFLFLLFYPGRKLLNFFLLATAANLLLNIAENRASPRQLVIYEHRKETFIGKVVAYGASLVAGGPGVPPAVRSHLLAAGAPDAVIDSLNLFQLPDGNQLFVNRKSTLLRVLFPPDPEIYRGLCLNAMLVEIPSRNSGKVQEICFKRLVLGNGLKSYERSKWKEICPGCWDLKSQGCYVLQE